MAPPQPQLSFPSPRYFTLYGAGCPLAARSLASVVGLSEVIYSNQSAASCTLPDPTFSEMKASEPIWPRKSKYSFVPKLLGSITPPQSGLSVAGRFAAAPTPLRQ